MDNSDEQQQPAEPPPITSLDTMKKIMWLYKTRTCPLNKRGQCFHGLRCFDSHEKQPQRRAPKMNEYNDWHPSTMKCTSIAEDSCKYGRACYFAHNDFEVHYHPTLYKTKSCVEFEKKGFCNLGMICPCFHYTNEQRKVDKDSLCSDCKSDGVSRKAPPPQEFRRWLDEQLQTSKVNKHNNNIINNNGSNNTNMKASKHNHLLSQTQSNNNNNVNGSNNNNQNITNGSLNSRTQVNGNNNICNEVEMELPPTNSQHDSSMTTSSSLSHQSHSSRPSSVHSSQFAVASNLNVPSSVASSPFIEQPEEKWIHNNQGYKKDNGHKIRYNNQSRQEQYLPSSSHLSMNLTRAQSSPQNGNTHSHLNNAHSHLQNDGHSNINNVNANNNANNNNHSIPSPSPYLQHSQSAHSHRNNNMNNAASASYPLLHTQQRQSPPSLNPTASQLSQLSSHHSHQSESRSTSNHSLSPFNQNGSNNNNIGNMIHKSENNINNNNGVDSVELEKKCIEIVKTYKVTRCPKSKCNNVYCDNYHDWRDRRRSPFSFKYSSIPCSRIFDAKTRLFTDNCYGCPFGDRCDSSHNYLEIWYHPKIFHTQYCPIKQYQKQCLWDFKCSHFHIKDHKRTKPVVMRSINDLVTNNNVIHNNNNGNNNNDNHHINPQMNNLKTKRSLSTGDMQNGSHNNVHHRYSPNYISGAQMHVNNHINNNNNNHHNQHHQMHINVNNNNHSHQHLQHTNKQDGLMGNQMNVNVNNMNANVNMNNMGPHRPPLTTNRSKLSGNNGSQDLSSVSVSSSSPPFSNPTTDITSNRNGLISPNLNSNKSSPPSSYSFNPLMQGISPSINSWRQKMDQTY